MGYNWGMKDKTQVTLKVWKSTADKLSVAAEVDGRTKVQFLDNIISQWLEQYVTDDEVRDR